jgi:DNA-3-methyladenine glycosylase
VLFRAMEPVFGRAQMAAARDVDLVVSPRPSQLRMISSGPGRMCEALGITRLRDNDKDFTSPRSGLWLADDGFIPKHIIATPRIGITKAADRPLRFAIAGNQYVSGRRIE